MLFRTRPRRLRRLGRRLLRSCFTLAAAGAAVGALVVLGDDETRAKLVAKARALRERLREGLEGQWQEASSGSTEWAREEPSALGSGEADEDPQG